MDGKYGAYSYVSSATRIREILDQPTGAFEETDSLPDRSKLSYNNGFYSNCSAIFVDIRDSSGLTKRHTRPVLAKLYRSFISEMVAVLNGSVNVREVNIVGDCVWAVYNTPYTKDIDDVFSTAAQANSLKDLLNGELARKQYETLKFGIGVEWGRALMIKAGYKGSGLNEVVYMGDVVNRAAHLAHEAGRQWAHPIWVGEDFADNLNAHNQSLLTKGYSGALGSYRSGTVVSSAMSEWIASTYK